MIFSGFMKENILNLLPVYVAWRTGMVPPTATLHGPLHTRHSRATTTDTHQRQAYVYIQ